MFLKNFSKYFVDVNGDIWSYRDGKVVKKLNKRKTYDGYWRVNMYDDNKKKHPVMLHQAVAEAYGLYDRKEEPHLTIDHIDGNIENNHITNLQCIGILENISKAVLFRGRRDGLPAGIYKKEDKFYFKALGFKSEMFDYEDDAFVARNLFHDYMYDASDVYIPPRRPYRWKTPKDKGGVWLSFK
jgi:hypothetical protein